MKIYSLINGVDNSTFKYFASRADAKAHKKASPDRNLKIAAVEIKTNRPGLAEFLNVNVLGQAPSAPTE
jgi:hypothetical protein